MRAELVEKLLVKIANLKYDEYQQFAPGTRFIESLIKWLDQFEKPEEKKVAYSFIINHLIFISNEQISHLVNITFSDKVNPILIKKTASRLDISQYHVRKIVCSKEYKEIVRRSLFIGVSDGAKIDLFRRSNSAISNEQVFPSYYISVEKAGDMIKELNREYKGKFSTIFLLDDFTASGKSYFRMENGQPAGKIHKFLISLFNNDANNLFRILIDSNEKLNIHIIFYLATHEALYAIEEAFTSFLMTQPNKENITFSIDAIQIIEKNISDDVKAQTDFINLISSQKYFDNSIVDVHYKKGNHKKPYLGFNECALPLILNHNSPNNSLPILWFPEDSICVGLFPRITRHKDE
jgi:hypothetical protein